MLILFVVVSHNPICGKGDCIEIPSGVDNILPVAVYNIVNFLGWMLPLTLKKKRKIEYLPAKCFQLLPVY